MRAKRKLRTIASWLPALKAALLDGPKSMPELAKAVGVSRPYAIELMRLLEAQGEFIEWERRPGRGTCPVAYYFIWSRKQHEEFVRQECA